MSAPKQIVWLDSIRSCPLFAGLPESDLRDVLEITTSRKLSKGEYLFREEDAVTGFYLVRVGAVSVQRINPQGQEKVIHVFRAGETFAEGALTSPTYPADAVALEECDLLHFSQAGYRNLLETRNEFSARTILSLCQHMRRMVADIENVQNTSAPCRLGLWLLERCENQCQGEIGPCRFEIGIRKSALAGELHMRGETLSRAFRKLQKAGLMEVNGAHVTVASPAALGEYVSTRKLTEG